MFTQNHKKVTDNTIAIVGFGFSGIAMFCHLVDKLINTTSEPHKIILFEKYANQFATGVPYTTNSPLIWTLNTPASKFKLMENGITLAEWMSHSKDKWKPLFPDINEEYPPRALVGLFLKDQYKSYKNKAISHGLLIEKYLEEVIDLNQNQDKWELITHRARHFFVNTLFLCFGHAPNDQFAHLTQAPNFFPVNSPVDVLKRIPNNANVYVIGGQASCIDIILWLVYLNHHIGRIYIITRNPAIITTKGNKDECDDSSINELTDILKTHSKNTLSFAEAKLLFWDAYRNVAKNRVDMVNPPKPQSALLYQIQKYKHSAISDETIGNIDELRSFIFNFYFSGCYNEFWDKLKDEDKTTFKQQFFSLIFAYLTGITPLNAQLLLELYDRNLIVEKHGLQAIEYNSEKNCFILQFSNNDREEAEYLIDSSGLGYDIHQQHSNFPLLTNLVKKGFLVPEKFGGILLNDHGQAFNNQNRLQANLICIGPTASYGHPVPTPYASFIAIKAIEKALMALSITPFFQLKKI